MFDSRVLETAIGLAFLFLGFSLMTMAIQEFIASAVKLRASTFAAGLKSILTDGENGLQFYNDLIGHPAVATATDNPSYVSASQFSNAVIQLISKNGATPTTPAALRAAITAVPNLQNMPDAPWKRALLSLIRDGETDISNFETRLQNWFDQSMDRVTGIYKRIAQYLSLGIGAVLSFGLQANAIAIATMLWLQPASANLGNSMSTVVKNSTLPDLDQMLPMLSQFHFEPIWSDIASGTFHLSFTWFLGCAITTFAVTLGAPFWFDMLQSFVSLRGSGPVPNKSTAPLVPSAAPNPAAANPQ